MGGPVAPAISENCIAWPIMVRMLMLSSFENGWNCAGSGGNGQRTRCVHKAIAQLVSRKLSNKAQGNWWFQQCLDRGHSNMERT